MLLLMYCSFTAIVKAKARTRPARSRPQHSRPRPPKARPRPRPNITGILVSTSIWRPKFRPRSVSRRKYRSQRRSHETGLGLGDFVSFNITSLRQIVHTHCVSVRQAAKLVAALLRVAGVTAGLAGSNGSLPPGL